ncbi:MAG TPA: TonB-dependent receptor [Bryobacteraceae bacterium]|jgi:hypothetical protein
MFRSILALALLFLLRAQAMVDMGIAGRVSDPQGHPVAHAAVQLVESGARQTTDETGHFQFTVASPGVYTVKVSATVFEEVTRTVQVATGAAAVVDVQLGTLSAKRESITVTADVKDVNVMSSDPAQRVYVRQETLDANPGRPGAPISIPGLPIETASGGIKAPQYFSPGVAGDHGEPIAEYIQVGSYLVSNNLSANAHGNGYADPNIMIPGILEGVQTDGGAFNVREGNHSEDLSATYELRSRLEPFVRITGDYRDLDLTAGWSPDAPNVKSWIAIEAAYGNGYLDRLEHRQQYKVNGFRVFDLGRHELTLFGIGYYGFSFIPGLTPVGVPNLRDTIDSRQKDQTRTGEIALNDDWQISANQRLQLSGFFRSYNLALYSNFGDGLIRQSEFRTVTGGNGTYIKSLGPALSLLAGVDYQRDAPRRLDLDHYELTDTSVYGPFQKVSANDVTIGDAAPYIALQGSLFRDLRYYAGWRRDEIEFNNTDLLNPQNSFSRLAGFNSPKATLSYQPADSAWAPSVSLSFGEAFYTNDPRIGTGTTQGTPISREHSYQLVASKTIAGTDFRVTLGHVTTEASLAKIDPDTGLQEDEGPGRNKFITVSARLLQIRPAASLGFQSGRARPFRRDAHAGSAAHDCGYSRRSESAAFWPTGARGI